MSSVHSDIGGSSAERWINCPGSVRLKKQLNGLDNRDSTARTEGQAAHILASQALESWKEHKEFIYPEFVPVTEGDNVTMVEVTDEMADAIDTYCTCIAYDFERYLKDRSFLEVEKAFTLSNIAEDCYGVCDAVFSSEEELFVYDFKYGKGKPVYAEENAQLMYYAVGAMVSMSKEQRDKLKRVTISVIQPRSFKIDFAITKWQTTVERLRAFSRTIKEAYYLATKNPNPAYNAGYWCESSFCPCMSFCPEITKEVDSVIADVVSEQIGSGLGRTEMELLKPERVAALLTIEDKVSAFFKRLNEYALHLAKTEKNIPGYKVVMSRKNKVWIDELEAERVLSTSLPGPVRRPGKLIPIGEAEKLFKKLKMAFPENLVTRPMGQEILVPSSDPRTELDTVDAFIALPDNQ